MNTGLHVSLTMNPYFFGSLILMAMWLFTYWRVRRRKKTQDVREFWWASWTCFLLGMTEPLYVPAYWDPPSLLKFYRWDFESFIFCFAIGGISAVFTELPGVKQAAKTVDHFLWEIFGRAIRGIRRMFGPEVHQPSAQRIHPGRVFVEPEQLKLRQDDLDNTILVIFFIAMLGATAQLNINIIYDAAIVCLSTAVLIWWRRPGLRWKIVGGALTFTVLYTVVLTTTHAFYPDFFSYWKLDQLSHIFIFSAPLEEYVFAFTFGAFWSPLYEAWKHEKLRRDSRTQPAPVRAQQQPPYVPKEGNGSEIRVKAGLRKTRSGRGNRRSGSSST